MPLGNFEGNDVPWPNGPARIDPYRYDKITNLAVKILIKNAKIEDYDKAKALLLEHGSVKKAQDSLVARHV